MLNVNLVWYRNPKFVIFVFKNPEPPEGYLPSVHLDCKITKKPLIDRDKKILLSPPLNKKQIPLQ